MYERFTERARRVMQLANEEAQRFNYEYIGTEHILLGLVSEGSGVATSVLKNLGIDLRKVRLEVEKIFPSNMDVVVTTGKLTPRARSVIEHAIKESRDLNCNHVGTEHLLLGLLREQEGVAAQVLWNLGLNTKDVREEILSRLRAASAPEMEPNHPPLVAPIVISGKRGGSMSTIAVQSIPVVPAPPLADPAPRRWTREEYYRLGESGFFHGQRVELIEGEIMVLSPQKAEHFTTTDHITELLRNAFGPAFWVRMQGPIDFGPISEPEPDVAVIAGTRAQYAAQHPQTAVLIVEVSESSLDNDRTRKASLYARAGIADYWIVNLVDRQLEVRRDPRPDVSQFYGHGYASVTILTPPAVVTPLAQPQVSLAVADLLP